MDALRAHFPALNKITYLNTAGGAPIPNVARQAADEYYRESYEDGDVHWSTWLDRVDLARQEVGNLVGADPQDVAFLGNATAGLNAVAELDAPGSFACAQGEFPSCTLPWLRRGFEPHPWPVNGRGEFSTDDVRSVLAPDTRVVVLSWVQFATGFRSDLKAVARLCDDRGIRLVVDGTQAVGAFPLNMRELGVDALVFSGYKWVTAGYGVAGLVIPGGFAGLGSPLAGWRSQSDPYSLISDRLNPDLSGSSAEGGHPPFPNVFSLGAAAKLWNQAGPAVTEKRITGLVRYLQAELDVRGMALLSSRRPEALSGIVMVADISPVRTAAGLKEQGILISARGAGLRVSLHAYNTEAEVDRLVGALAAIRGQL